MPVEQVVTVSLPGDGTPALWAALTAAGRSLTGAVRVVVVRGDAADFFHDASHPDVADEPPAAAIEWLGRPDLISIAAIRGRASTAGIDVALACDLRVVADDAQLSASRSVGGIGLLGELMGYSAALAFAVAGGTTSGRQAAASGLANLSVESHMLDAAVDELVATVLATPREVATVAKAVLRDSGAQRRRLVGDLAAGIRLAANEP